MKWIILFSFLCYSCSVIDSTEIEVIEQKVQLSTSLTTSFSAHPYAIGDQIKYRFYYGSNYWTDEIFRCYTNDTLILEVIDTIGANIISFKEYLSPYSEVFNHPDSIYIWTQETEASVTWTFTKDALVISDTNTPSENSDFTLSFFLKELLFENDPIEPVIFTKWKPEPLNGNYCDNVDILGANYSGLNVLVDKHANRCGWKWCHCRL